MRTNNLSQNMRYSCINLHNRKAAVSPGDSSSHLEQFCISIHWCLAPAPLRWRRPQATLQQEASQELGTLVSVSQVGAPCERVRVSAQRAKKLILRVAGRLLLARAGVARRND